MTDERYHVNLDSAAHYLGVSTFRMEVYVAKGLVPIHHDAKGRLRFDQAELDEWAKLQIGRDEIISWYHRPKAT